MFLIPQDYNAIIQAEILGTISGGHQYNIDNIELAALGEMQGYLRSRFDLAKIFFSVLEYSANRQYQTGQYCYFSVELNAQLEQFVFKSSADSVGIEPVLDGNESWEMFDERHPVVKMYLVDMVLYHLHAAISPRMIPELRETRYKAAINWLKMVRDGELTTDLPLLIAPPDEAGKVFYLGSNPKLKHIW